MLQPIEDTGWQSATGCNTFGLGEDATTAPRSISDLAQRRMVARLPGSWESRVLEPRWELVEKDEGDFDPEPKHP